MLFPTKALSTITPRNLVDSVCCITRYSKNNAISGGLFDLARQTDSAENSGTCAP